MIKQIGSLEDNILEKINNNHEALSIKCYHLTQQNAKLHHSLKDLEAQLYSLRAINSQLVSNSPKTVQIILEQLTKQNANLQKSLFRLIKINEELSSDVLMKNQLIAENDNQFRELVNSYENKIFQLRTNLQAKQCFMTNIQQKKNAQKGETFLIPCRGNVMYLNQLSQLKSLNERYHIENTSLQLLVASKNQQIEELKLRIQVCQKTLKNGQSWAAYSNRGQNSAQIQKTKQKSVFKVKLEQELTRYDSKYRNISFHQSKSSNNSSHVHNLKLLISQIYVALQKMEEQNKTLKKKLVTKEKDLHEINLAYRYLQMEMQQQKIQVDFYRHNFKELTKVTTERKIKYFDEYFPVSLPLIKQQFNNHKQIVEYWKEQHKSKSSFYGNQAKQRRMLSKLVKKVNLKSQKRSNSCISKYNVFVQRSRKICEDLKIQNSVISFINQTHNVPSVMGYTLEQKGQHVKNKEEQNILFGEISVIQKPSKPIGKFGKIDRKELFLEQEL